MNDYGVTLDKSDLQSILDGALDLFVEYKAIGWEHLAAKREVIRMILNGVEAAMSDCPTCGGSGGADAPNHCIACMGSGKVDID